MTPEERQTILEAVRKRWLFWLYFWRIPRYLKAMADEMDRVWSEEARFLQERSGIIQARDNSIKANKSLLRWIHVTHRLNVAPEAIRALFAAGKRLSVFLLFLSVFSLNAQQPPFLRNQWTTNANPIAVKVISTNGVQAATNVWDLDFTNTASVSVNVVSNAGKVVFSFIGATNSGAGTFKTVLTNGVIAVTNIAEIDLTNNTQFSWLVTSNAGQRAVIQPSISAQPPSGNLTNWSNIATGAIVAGSTIWTNDNGILHPLGMTNEVQFGTVTPGWGILYSVYDGGNLQFVTNGTQIFFIDSGLIAAEFDEFCFTNQTTVFEGGLGSGFFERATNCTWSVAAGVSSASFRRALRGTVSTDTGSFAASTQERSVDTRMEATHGSVGTAHMQIVSNINVDIDHGAFAVADFDTATNCSLIIPSGAMAMIYAHNGFNMNGSASAGSFAGGALLANDERLHAEGGAVGAFAFGRDVASTNNWTFGIHYTNAVPLSLAVGADGITQFRAASNSVVIRSGTAPTVGQILTATDTIGTVGWSNAPAGSSGGIASIFTNNVLAGGPGLTELGFTNTATVTATATTNAGRVTVSFDASVLGAGIAVQGGGGNFNTFTNATITSTSPAPTAVSLVVNTVPGQTNYAIRVNNTNGSQTVSITPGGRITSSLDMVNNGTLSRNVSIGYFSSDSLSFAGSAGVVDWPNSRIFQYGSGTNGFGVGASSTATGSIIASNGVFKGQLTSASLVNSSATVSLTADDQSVSVTNRSYIRLSSDNGTAGNRTFVLTSGTHDGQMVDLEWTGTNAGELVDDFSATGGGNGRLSATWTPTQYDVIALRWNGTDWIERSRSAN